MLAEIGKFVGGRVVTAVIVLATGAAGYWCWQHPETVAGFGRMAQSTLLWLLLAAALPWCSFLFMRPFMEAQTRMTSPRAATLCGLAPIAAFSLLDVLAALWLGAGTARGLAAWCVLLLGFLAAAAYNFVICESLARRIEP
jgi:hypothetical protein